MKKRIFYNNGGVKGCQVDHHLTVLMCVGSLTSSGKVEVGKGYETENLSDFATSPKVGHSRKLPVLVK
jgi:hypothetical protein